MLQPQAILIPFLLTLVSAFSWPWQDDETTSLQSARPTSTTSASSSQYMSGATEFAFSSSYYADGQAYAPKATQCPSTPIMREAKNISESEKEYVENRQQVTNENLIEFLDKVADLADFDAETFVSESTRNISIGLAFSGGGYRAMLAGAGNLLALDSRFEESKKNALGGLLQSSTYVTGLSGGSWLVGSLAVNNWISVADILQENSGLWDLSDSIFNPSGINLVSTVVYYNQLRKAVSAKSDAGFETSITDVWGRALSYQFFNDTFYNGGENFTWTGVTQTPSFQDYEMPFPILVADGRNPGTTIVNLNSTVFEMSPYELGSWDSSLNSFVDSRFLGTSLDNGTPNDTYCVTNFDNAGFFMGTSSSLFNQILLKVETSTSLNWALQKLLQTILGAFSRTDTDIATYAPNPFYNSQYADSETMISSRSLNLVDGGEDNQNIPYYPLIQNSRDVDVIFSFDNSADTAENWPNGSAIAYTFKRQFTAQGFGTPFPYVPSYDTFIKDGLNQKPVFFGCNASDLSSLVELHGSKKNTTDVPLVVYVPNSRYSYDANISTYQMEYDNDEKVSLIQNGYEVMSLNNRTADKNWNKCVGCAIIRREQERRGEEQSDECRQCFSDYCWVGGIEDSAEPNASILLAVVTESASSTMSDSSLTSAMESFQTGESSSSERSSSVSSSESVSRTSGSSGSGSGITTSTTSADSTRGNAADASSSDSSGAKRGVISTSLLACLVGLLSVVA